MAKYTYFIDFGAGEIEFIPDADFVYVWEKQNDQAAFMRKGVKEFTITKDYDNAGTFINEDVFNTLWEWYFDNTKQTTEITVKVYKNGVEDYVGLFYVPEGDIDVNDGFYTVKPINDDKYRIFLGYADNEVDIIDESGSIDKYIADYLYGAEIERFPYTSSTPPTNSVDGSPLPDGCWYYPHNRPDLSAYWVRMKSQHNIDDSYAVTPYRAKYNGYWYYKSDYGESNPHYQFPNCQKLTDSIQFLLDNMLEGTELEGMQFVSHFFMDANNYVTGAVNTLRNTLIQQRSDTKDPDASDKATIGRLSFNQMMADLSSMFNVRWFIDGDDLRIEHERYFYNGLNINPPKGICVDLTDESKYKADEINNLYTLDRQKFAGNSDSKVKLETISLQDVVMDDFRDDINYIEYDVIRFNDAKKTNTVAYFITDINKMINDPTALSDDGFSMFAIDYIVGDKGSVNRIHEYFSNALNPALYIGNAAFSVKWLIHDWYEYGRQDGSGFEHIAGSIHPGDLFNIIATQPIYTQKDIVFKLNDADTIDINKYIATYLIKSDEEKYVMNGSIISIQHDLYDDFVTVTLGFELL